MELLEGVFRKGWKEFARLNSGGKSYFKPIENRAVAFTESKDGKWTHLTNPKIKYDMNVTTTSGANKTQKEYESMMKKCSTVKPKVLFSHDYWKRGRANINIWYIDIEAIDINNKSFPDVFNPIIPVTHIQILNSRTDSGIILMTKDISEEVKSELKEKYKDKMSSLNFVCFKSELEMFEGFSKLLDNLMPTILIGWNAETFDFPYMTKRAEYIGFEIEKLSPLGNISFREFEEFGKKKLRCDWAGLYLLDLMEAFKKFTFKEQKSYSIENISKVILGVGSGKVDYQEHKSIHRFYEHNYDGFVDYAIMDIVLLKEIDLKVGLTSLIQTLAEMMGCNYTEVFGTVAPWTILLTHLSLDAGFVLPAHSEFQSSMPIVGGFVKNPILGLLEWLFSYDYNSLYPSLQVSFNLSPDMYIREIDLPEDAVKILRLVNENEEIFLSEDGPALFKQVGEICERENIIFAGLGFFKKHSQGILPKVLEEYYYQRKKEKNQGKLAEAILSNN